MKLSNVYTCELKRGYFHAYTEHILDSAGLKREKEDIYALNTLVWQLFYIYKNYEPAFKKFELIELKGNEDDDANKQTNKCFRKHKQEYGLGIISNQQGKDY